MGGFFILLEPSNFCCPPAKPGVYLTKIIAESAIWSRIKDSHQSHCRIAAKIPAEFIYFINHNQRVAHTGSSQGLNSPSRHSPYIDASLSSQFRLIRKKVTAELMTLVLKNPLNIEKVFG